PTVGGRDYLGPSAARRLYACRDGWLCVSAADAAAAVLGRLAGVALAPDAAAGGREAGVVAAMLGVLGRAPALGAPAGAGVPAAPCLRFAEMLADEHLRANGMFVTLDDPTLGAVTLSAPFVDFERTPAVVRRLGPAPGEHGREILAD